MIITHKLQPMDLASRGVPQRVDVMQDDKYSRNLQISLYENGSRWQIPIDVVAVIRYKKSDGTGGNYDTLPDGNLAYDISGNVLTVALAPQVCTAPGLVDFAVCLIQAESEITTFAVNINVQPVPGADIASEEYENLTLRFFFVTQAEYDALPEEEKLAGTYFITDQGNDTDTSLSIAGRAADALAVGERFKKVERILPSVTAEDAGKALVVSVDGKIVADDGMTEQDVLAEQVLTFATQDPEHPGNPYVTEFADPIILIGGETYYVDWDGSVYETTAWKLEFDGTLFVTIGNRALTNMGDDTGEPFVFGYVRENGDEGFIAGTNSPDLTLPEVSHTVRIYQMVKDTSSQSDWNINDETNPAYIKNRPFYMGDPVLTEIFPETTVPFEYYEEDGIRSAMLSENFGYQPTEGEAFVVNWDGVDYSLQWFVTQDGDQMSILGNLGIIGEGEDSGEPFIIFTDGTQIIAHTISEAAEHTILLAANKTFVKKIDKYYLPDMIGNPGTGVNAEIFNDKITNIASGDYSHAEGYGTSASGNYSHAEGQASQASGENSHAEGSNTTASMNCSHAEGDHTKASSAKQHVQGTYNIDDTAGKYAHIVGNGKSDNERSNAHTLDWDGNAWYAGYVEGKKFILPSTTAGSTKRFAITVDDSGTLSVTEVTE